MQANIFAVPAPVVAHVTQAAAQLQNNVISNQILGRAPPSIPATNKTLTAARYLLLTTTLRNHDAAARTVATKWQSVGDLVTTFWNDFIHFNRWMQVEYKKLVELAYVAQKSPSAAAKAAVTAQLERIQSFLEPLINHTNGTATSVADYEGALKTALDAYNADYDRVMDGIKDVASVVVALETSIQKLLADIDDNNRAVMETFLDSAGEGLVQGASIFEGAATDDGKGVVSAGAQLGVSQVKGGVKIVRLNQATLDDLSQIREQTKSLGEDMVVLMALVNIGTNLAMLGSVGGTSLQIVGDILQYWSDMNNAIADTLRMPDPSAAIDIVNFDPAREGQNPLNTPWSVLLPLARAATAFQGVLDAQLVTFGADTKLQPLT